MNQILRYSIFLLSLFVATTSLSQTIDTIFGCDDIPPLGTGPVCTICNFDVLYGTTFPFTPSPDAGWCGTIENDQYIGFVAGPTGSVVFQMETFNCVTGNGLQVGIYDQGNNLVGDCFNQVFPGTPQIFTANALTPGEVYYIRIDGFAGDGCEFFIQVIAGLLNQPPAPAGPIMGPQSVCWDDSYSYFIDPVQSATSYYWRVSPGPYTSGVNVDPPVATNPSIGTPSLGVEIEIPMADPNMPLGTCDDILVEVFPLNPCFSRGDSSTFVIEVCRSANPPDTIFTTGTYLHCEAGYVYPPSGRQYPEGTHYFTNTDSNGQNVCEETIALTVDRIGDPLVVDVLSIPISCNMNGTIDLDISGGITPYTFTWSNGNTSEDLTNLDSGFYALTIIDSVGCTFDTVYRVRHISEEQLDFYTNSTDCNGNGGSAYIDTTLLDNYRIEWSTGDTGPSITNLMGGRYGIAIVDSISECRLDSFFHIGVQPSCYSILSGKVVSDLQINCASPANYVPLVGVIVECSNGERVSTDQNGIYQFQVDTGTYTITVQNIRPTSLLPVCATNLIVSVDAYQQTYANNNFYFERTNDPDISLSMVKSTPSRGRTNTIDLQACNFDSAAANFSVSFNYTDLQTFTFSNPRYSSIDTASKTVTWNFTGLESYECEEIRIWLDTKISTMVGDTIMYMAFTDSITTSIDVTPIDNELFCKAVVIGSYDPNDKLVTPIGRGTEGIIELSDTLLQYTIRFQNTGSDDAWYVRLEDQISEHLDLRTLKVIGASHDHEVSFNEDRNLFVVFDPIVLPPAMMDSVGSQGYFSFTIETTNDIEPADRIENTAAIYFDFNDPIITNTTVNTIRSTSSTRETTDQPSFVIFPNPTQGELTVQLQEEQQVESIHLISLDGRLLSALDFQGAGKAYKLDLKNIGIAQGIYTLRLTLASGEVMHQLFVLKQ